MLEAFNRLSWGSGKIYYSASIFQFPVKIWRHTRSTLLFYLILLNSVKQEMKKIYYKRHLKIDLLISRFFTYIAWALWNYPLFHQFSSLFSFLFERFSVTENLSIRFFVISNLTINARFLSRFIARKLKQNYSLYEMINPLRSELRQVSKQLSDSLFSYFLQRNYFSEYGLKKVRQKKEFFLKLLVYLTTLYYNFSYKNYSLISTWLLFDNFFFNNSVISSDSRYTVNVTFNFVKYYFILVYFFFNTNHDKLLNVLYIPKNIQLMRLFTNFKDYFGVVYNLLFVNYSNLYLSQSKVRSLGGAFRASSALFLRFLDFNYFYYNYERDAHLFRFNKRKARNKRFSRSSSLIGFKFHCVGRFTRKQRASSVWFIEMTMPLTQIDAHIDYSFFTIPLKNSSVGIKIWLYRKEHYDKFYVKLM